MNMFNSPADHLFLREGTTYTKISLTDIYFIQADGNYAYIQTAEKKFAVKRSLAAIVEELNVPSFIRVSRGVLVNFDQVSAISFAEASISLGAYSVKLGKAYHAEVKSRMPRL